MHLEVLEISSVIMLRGVLLSILWTTMSYGHLLGQPIGGDSRLQTVRESTTDIAPDQHAVCEWPYVQHSVSTALAVKQPANSSIGQQIEVQCKEGYRFPHRSSKLRLTCHLNGTWVDAAGNLEISSCNRIGSCPLLPISHGSMMRNNDGYLVGDLVLITCDPQYELQPPQPRYLSCQHDGSWATLLNSNLLPTCEELTCVPPQQIAHSTYTLYDGTPVEPDGVVKERSVIHYQCDSGYHLTSESVSIFKCQRGQWMPPNKRPKCVKAQPSGKCGRPARIDNAYCRILETNEDCDGEQETWFGPNVHAVHSCNPGYKTYGVSSLQCSHGTWQGSYLSCQVELNICAVIPQIDHGKYQVTDAVDSHLPEGVVNGTTVYYYCDNGYRLSHRNESVLLCKDAHWYGALPQCIKRTSCDTPMDIRNGNWIIVFFRLSYGIGSVIQYNCDEGYHAYGTTDLRCMDSGYWNDNTPQCLPKANYCPEPGSIQNGFYMCKPSHCNLYKLNTELHYVCNQDYEPPPDQTMKQICLVGGKWSGAKPTCLPVHKMISSPNIHFSTSTLTVVIATSCGVLGLLVVVMLAVALQRRIKPPRSGRGRLCHPGPPPPPAYSQPPRTALDEHDRVALIAFAEGVQVVLPSYEEATRSGSMRGPPRLTRFNSDASSHSSSGRSSRADYRPLPSIPPTLRGGVPQMRDHQAMERDHHRNSIVTTTSITTRDNLSLALAMGSMDTMNISDGTSTSVTVDTFDSGASNPSLALSQRAAAGSLESSSTHGSLAGEDAPLLEQSHFYTDTLRSHGSTSLWSQASHDQRSERGSERCETPVRSSSVERSDVAPHRADTLHSQGSRSIHSDSSPIMELGVQETKEE